MKIPNIHKLSKASQLSFLAIVILLGAIYFTVNNALQTQNDSSHASGAIVYQSGNYYCYYLGLSFKCNTLTPSPIQIATLAPSSQSLTNFVLWNASNKTQLFAMTNGMTINLATLPSCLDITASTDPQTVGSVKFSYDSNSSFEDSDSSPYWFEDTDQSNSPVCFNYTVGEHTIIATPYTQSGESGSAGKSLTITFQVINSQLTTTSVPTIVPTATPTILPTLIPSPTDTTPGDTNIALVVGLHGIGTAGDSANPGSDGNMNPLHPQRNITVFVFNSQNQQVSEEQGTVTYDSSTGLFDGNVDLGLQLLTGLYTVKVETAQYLRGLVPGIQSLTQGQTTTLPKVVLVAGVINGDNQINILDYNIMMGCYSDLLPAVSCTLANKGLSDLNDDGAVNQFDYNLFLRELSNVTGN